MPAPDAAKRAGPSGNGKRDPSAAWGENSRPPSGCRRLSPENTAILSSSTSAGFWIRRWIRRKRPPAYAAILDFLDNLEELPFPPELEESLRTACEKLTEASLAQADAAMEAALAEPDRYLSENQEAIRNYLAYRSSPAFRRSPAGALRRQLLAFQQAVGYEGFLRNLERLSPAYRAYRQRIALADESFRRQFPEAAALFDEEQAALVRCRG